MTLFLITPAIAVLRHAETGRYHTCLFTERSMPGPDDPTRSFVRLQSKGHHTEGADTFEGALVHADVLAADADVPANSVDLDSLTPTDA